MGIKERAAVLESDTWDLSQLYPSITTWESDFQQLEQSLSGLSQFQGLLASSADELLNALTSIYQFSRKLEKLYTYAHLLSDQDTSDSDHKALVQRAMNLYSRFSAAISYFKPELLQIDDKVMSGFLADAKLKDYKRALNETLRYKPHTLSSSEEELLAQSTEAMQTAKNVFGQLFNADLEFGEIEIDGEKRPITHGSIGVILRLPNREVRKEAFEKFYSAFDAHKNTLAATYAGSIQKDVFYARAKRYESALMMGLFGDNVSQSVYDNLIDTISKSLGSIHKYYQMRKEQLGVSTQELYDVYVSLLPEVKINFSYEEAVEICVEALAPLGNEYCQVLKQGLLEKRWVDRYENRGKRAGAYQSSCYDSNPYILMNYNETNLNDMFTLIHEAGHAMHSYFSAKSQNYQDHDYTIFVAEVASTVNEQLLAKFLREKYKNDQEMSAYLVNYEIESIRQTMHRQTMFAEFEKIVHEHAEKNQPLTLSFFRSEYRALLEKYFGSSMHISEYAELEGLRVPHFYNAFYVYKYSTGIAAAVALSKRILNGAKAVDDYYKLLRGGCSKYPIEILKDAGVDMSTPEPVEAALTHFNSLVLELTDCLSSSN